MYKKDHTTDMRNKLLAKLNPHKCPEHVGIIMDGNRRWSEKENLPKIEGHYQGYQNLKRLLDTVVQTPLKVLSLYVLSSKNIYKRNKDEIHNLYDLLISGLKELFDDSRVKQYNLEVIVSGRKNLLSEGLIGEIDRIEQATFGKGGKLFNLCIGYDGYEEVVDATKEVCRMVQDKKIDINDVDEETIKNNLYARGRVPAVDLVIRTGSEKGQRVSGFMLWDLSYAEFMFTKTLFPDFTDKEFLEMLVDFQDRNIRTFGK